MSINSLKDVLLYHVRAIKAGFLPSIFTYNQLIRLYSLHSLLHYARKLFDEMPDQNVYSWNAIISAYIRSENVAKALEYFDAVPHRDLVTYNTMLSGYVSSEGWEAHAVQLFMRIQSADEEIRMDEFSMTTMLKLCSKLSEFSYGRQLHAFMVKTGNDLTGFAVSSLIDMYSKCGRFTEALHVFERSRGEVDLVSKNAMVAACCREGKWDLALRLFWRNPELNDVVSWNTLISGYVQNGYDKESLDLFVQMPEYGFRWNEHTFASVLSACSGSRSLKLGKEVHAWVLKNGMTINPFISSGIVDVYCKCGNMRYAELAHEAMGTGNSFSVTSMISGYSSTGNIANARKLFDSLADKTSVAWTALLSGYVKLQQCEAFFDLLSEFLENEATVRDPLILICIISVSAIQSSLPSGKQIHGCILRLGIEMDKKLASSLVDMYSKCGSINYAEKIFGRTIDRDLVLYNVMIAGYAHHGHESEAIKHYVGMLERGIIPDAVTFIALLSACRHGGLVELGQQFFHSMTKEYGLFPETDHCACIIDLYGRANQLEKALAFMREIPVEPDAVVWGAFLNACRMNGNTEFAKEAEQKLLKTEGENGARYVQLANAYAADGSWDEMSKIRKKMRGKDVRKIAGCSWVYVENNVHTFTSGDKCHLKTENIYSILACLTEELYNTAETNCLSRYY